MDRIKYPRTLHFPWSPGATDDDKVLTSVDVFVGQEIVKTEKMDGENTTLYGDGYTHARSIDSAHHPSRAWVKAEAARVSRDLPPGWRVCGENLYAEHSIRYDRLPSYFLVFGIYDTENNAIAWSEVEEWCQLLDLHTVPVLYRGPWDEARVREIPTKSAYGPTPEGYVVRIAQGFSFPDFGRSVAKYVRKNHVQTDEHWMQQVVKPNLLDTSSAKS